MGDNIERRSDYMNLGNKFDELRDELANNSKEQAITNANLNNIIKMFEVHLDDDKETVKRVDDLEKSVSNMKGRIWGAVTTAAAASAVFGSIIGAVIGVFLNK